MMTFLFFDRGPKRSKVMFLFKEANVCEASVSLMMLCCLCVCFFLKSLVNAKKK